MTHLGGEEALVLRPCRSGCPPSGRGLRARRRPRSARGVAVAKMSATHVGAHPRVGVRRRAPTSRRRATQVAPARGALPSSRTCPTVVDESSRWTCALARSPTARRAAAAVRSRQRCATTSSSAWLDGTVLPGVRQRAPRRWPACQRCRAPRRGRAPPRRPPTLTGGPPPTSGRAGRRSAQVMVGVVLADVELQVRQGAGEPGIADRARRARRSWRPRRSPSRRPRRRRTGRDATLRSTAPRSRSSSRSATCSTSAPACHAAWSIRPSRRSWWGLGREVAQPGRDLVGDRACAARPHRGDAQPADHEARAVQVEVLLTDRSPAIVSTRNREGPRRVHRRRCATWTGRARRRRPRCRRAGACCSSTHPGSSTRSITSMPEANRTCPVRCQPSAPCVARTPVPAERVAHTP